MAQAPQLRHGQSMPNPDIAAACLQGTLAELARMRQVGVVPGPAMRWKDDLVSLFRRVGG
jgi:hypothetical protein